METGLKQLRRAEALAETSDDGEAPATPWLPVVDELDDVLVMQSFFLDVVDALTHPAGDGMTQAASHDGLTLWGRLLHERGTTLKQHVASVSTEDGE